MREQKEKVSIARELYNEGITQMRIAEILGVTEGTVSRWAVKEGWSEKREAISADRQFIQESAYELMAYQMRALVKQKDTMLASGEMSLLDKGLGDFFGKFYSLVKTGGLTMGDYARVFSDLLRFISVQDPELAQKMVAYTDAFMSEKAKTYSSQG
jgi:predicted transcriptional regulator